MIGIERRIGKISVDHQLRNALGRLSDGSSNRTTGQEIPAGRWIARAQHDHLAAAYTYQVVGYAKFFCKIHPERASI